MKKSRKMKSRRNKKAGSRKHKPWHMKGCSCMQKGGCNTCITGMHGGNFYKPAAPIPGPFVGQPWTPAISGWPGVDGVGANRNYIADNLYPTDISRQMKLGGKRRKNKKSKINQIFKNLKI